MMDHSSAKYLSLSWDQVLPVGAGLWNVGNTCFMNSVLQCLSYTAPLVNYTLSGEHVRTCSRYRFCMSCTLENHITETINNSGTAIVPARVVTQLNLIGEQFCLGQQEDAHEFLRYTVHALQQSYPNGKMLGRETNLINQIFEGRMRSRVKCLNCKADSDTFEPFMDVALDITGAKDLTESLQRFVKPEQLGDGYKCTRCMETSPASKKLTIHHSSNVLTICLKRFNYYGRKISTLVKYPKRLDMRPFMSESEGESQVYELYAVLVHAGYSCHCGHYYCYVKASDRNWYKMDDEQVSVADERSVLNQQAYMLFYIRTSEKPMAEGRSQGYSGSTYRKCSETCDTKQQSTGKRKRCQSPDREESQPAAKRAIVEIPATDQRLLKISRKCKRKRCPSPEREESEPAAKRARIETHRTCDTKQQITGKRKRCPSPVREESQPSAKLPIIETYRTCDTKQQITGKRKRCPRPKREEFQPAAKRAQIQTPATDQQLLQEKKKLQIRTSEKLKQRRGAVKTAMRMASALKSVAPNS
ncbi:ubiquitin carboxyl-terminal hydrolase 42 isoform X1 [Astyanax mexicanus]|uniref:ubiquitin carboxyl-terminal hydrolase 42 isoform X1 n=1 Tax=Astyanax mexicanus TaxID=7994 RepID=UPI0020CAFC42|nr:ubiquitin carboxyl-terminal hydrolase 42 isoform X1 [Astyanax mexicanus]